jgi:hypothetical protein
MAGPAFLCDVLLSFVSATIARPALSRTIEWRWRESIDAIPR